MLSRFVRTVRSAAAAAVVVVAFSVPAAAGIIVDISGDIASVPGSSYSRFSGGSFSGSFSFAGDLPVGSGATAFFDAFTVNLYDASDTLLLTLSSSVSGSYGYVSNAYVPFYGGDIVDFFAPDGSYLQLVFAAGFTGNGGLASSGLGGNSYLYQSPGHYGYIASATASIRTTPIPEPATILLLVAGFASAMVSVAAVQGPRGFAA